MAKKKLENEEDTFDVKDALIKKTKEARIRWRKIVKSNELERYEFQGESERSPKKYLYLVKPGAWWEEMQAEIKKLEVKIKNAGFVGRGKPRRLWLPELIKDAAIITIKTYQAKSSRAVLSEAAADFAHKEGLKAAEIKKTVIKNGRKKRSIDSKTGLNYKLRVITASSSKINYHGFPNWTVCLCSNEKLPEVYEEAPEYTAKSKAKIPLCESKDGNRVLVGWKKPTKEDSNPTT